MKNIKAIIFDLGGVILNIDYNLTVKEFEKLGVLNSASYYSKSEQKKLFDDLETGKISEKEFIDSIKQSFYRSTYLQGWKMISNNYLSFLDQPS